MKRKIILKYLSKLIIIFFTSLLIGMTVTSSVENIYINRRINSFKSKGVFQEELSSDTERYYKVSRETWMSETPSYVVMDGIMTYGGPGDIVVGMESNVKNMPGITDMLEFYVGGHTSSVCFDESYDGVTYKSNHSIESKPESGVRCVHNKFWNNIDYQNEVVCLRVRTSEETINKAFHYMCDQIGKKYNKAFIVNTKNRYYCSDLISRAYKSQGVTLNSDGFFTSVHDLICSPMTYISFYKEYKKGISYYYYLG